jgi:hypothetical protein
MTWTTVDLKGQTHFKLKVTSFAERRGTHTYWNCTCDCGNTIVVRGSAITSGKAKSCGCFRSESIGNWNKRRRNPDPWISEMNVYRYHLSVDKLSRRHLAITWGLNLEEYKVLVTSNCYYCGAEPSGLPLLKHLRGSGVRKSGIDRVDNLKGYEPGNCVPCCAGCNREKGARTQGEFLESTRRRYLHLQKIGLI